MKNIKKLIIFFITIIAILSTPIHSYAWWAVDSYTSKQGYHDIHGDVSKHSVDSVGDFYLCPDIGYYNDTIITATDTVKNDAHSHGGASKNGGPIDQWWKYAKEQYKKNNFGGDSGSYYYIGQMIHLVQDMTVPSHAFDIPHWMRTEDSTGALLYDNFEGCASLYGYDTFMPYDSYKRNILDKEPDKYMEIVRSGAINKVINSKMKRYWTYFNYPKFKDTFPLTLNSESYRFISDQIEDSESYTEGCLIDTSKRLPALINNLITSKYGDKWKISYDILDNRTENVEISIRAKDENNGTFIKDIYGNKYDDLAIKLNRNSNKKELPWKKHFDIVFNNEDLPDGKFRIYLSVKDEDKNVFPSHNSVDDDAKLFFNRYSCEIDNSQNTTSVVLKQNDFVIFGNYNSKKILWTCAREMFDGLALFANDIICKKSFGYNNNWETSTIREWLNSTNKNIKQPYLESGFLTNFTTKELNMIKPHDKDGFTEYVWLWNDCIFSDTVSGTTEEYWTIFDDSDKVVDYYLPVYKERYVGNIAYPPPGKEGIDWYVDQKTREVFARDIDNGKFVVVGKFVKYIDHYDPVYKWVNNGKVQCGNGNSYFPSESKGIRPILALNSYTVNVSKGNGTLTDPYIIK
jgi:hypothetical protein